ncbi:acyl-CoA dehydrogenase family protein [Desulfobacterales bacterium HSG16]|nr:acyl-CoA dehydrogenase family protein [Desulfobacterales bacterium HSG16]
MEILNYTKDHEAFRGRLQTFLNQEVVPHINRFEKEHLVSKDIWKKMGKNGFLCTNISKEYGGMGADFLYSVIVAEEIAKINFTGLAAPLHSDIIVPYINSFGSREQKKKYLPGCVSGEIITAVAMTEPDAGSDIASITTTAVEDGSDIIINGSKTFISNAVNCDLVILVAKDPAIENKHQALSLYLIDADTPGFSKGKPFEKMGWRSQDTGELFFNNCRIPKENRLGDAGMGFFMLMEKLQQERLVVTLGAVFGAEYMINWTMEYCKKTSGSRSGKPLIKSQAVQFAIVEMKTEASLGKVFTEKLVADHMEGKNVVIETSMAKYWTTDMAKRTALRCLDIAGNFGTLEECPLARAWRDVRVTSIFAGTNEIMKGIAAKFMGM